VPLTGFRWASAASSTLSSLPPCFRGKLDVEADVLLDVLQGVDRGRPTPPADTARSTSYRAGMASKKTSKDDGHIAENRRARYDYEIGETFECGLELKGAEVKSLRARNVSFGDAFAYLDDGQLWLHNLKIERYRQQSTIEELDPSRRRRLLLNKGELDRIRKLTQERGYTLVPLKMYFKGPWAKVLLGVAKGKTREDKRETIRAREASRDVARALRRG
jgi:SsrA-binding protein